MNLIYHNFEIKKPSLVCVVLVLHCRFGVLTNSRRRSARTSLMVYGIGLPSRRDARGKLEDQPFASITLTKAESEQARQLLWDDHVAEIHATREKEWQDKAIVVRRAHDEMEAETFLELNPPPGGIFYISLHGGGGAAGGGERPAMGKPDQSLSAGKIVFTIASRAPTNDWDLWFQPDIDIMLDRMIEDAIVLAEVNPNRIYITGYSAGGNGVYRLGPHGGSMGLPSATMARSSPDEDQALSLRGSSLCGSYRSSG